MDEQELIDLTEENIRQALRDYHRYTDLTDVYDDVSDGFISRLAKDSVRAKRELRELFRKSPVWNEELQALIINGTRTHDPDLYLIRRLARQILDRPMCADDCKKYDLIENALDFFTLPEGVDRTDSIKAIQKIAPKAYAEGKKPSRIFKALCAELGVVDETAGSEFQKLYAQFADELTTRKISFKLFVSINPAHFITMSNPKEDRRGCTLTSCHSFNSTEYEYNCGCTGYARDKTSFIVFTVADPDVPEYLNNRKTTRQVFAYQPGNGVLLQSRLYNTSGGTTGAQEESKVYRDLIQREISALEDVPNLWKTSPATSNEMRDCVERGYGFGGYADWTYEQFDGKISIRKDCAEKFKTIKVGTYGLCVCCGEETNYGLYCDDCDEGGWRCDDCDCRCDEDDLTTVYACRGNEIRVCGRCLDDHYTYCDCCEEYYPNDYVTNVGDERFCEDCLNDHCSQCDECGEYFRNEDLFSAIDACGNDVRVCEDCRDECYTECDCCGNYVKDSAINDAYAEGGARIDVCDSCLSENFECCEKCEEWHPLTVMRDGCCPNCWDEVETEAEAEERKVETA